MSDNGQAQTYRFMELTTQHQVQLLRQQILQLEQQLYGLAVQEESMATRKALAVQELERLRDQVQRLLRPAQPEAPADAPEEAAP